MHQFERTAPDDAKNNKNGPADKLIAHRMRAKLIKQEQIAYLIYLRIFGYILKLKSYEPGQIKQHLYQGAEGLG